MRIDSNGFYQPYITSTEECIDCSLCLKNCAYYNTETSSAKEPPIGYATWSNNPQIRQAASSGGTGYEIAHFLVEKGYIFCGVKYDVKNGRAEHYLAESVDEIKDSTGSKYIQSFTLNAFKQIDFKNKKYVVFGTPCQIASLHRLIGRKGTRDNFVLVDFFCHGVPSMLLWGKYINWAESKVGKISQVKWRNKSTGWHDSWNMIACGNNCETIDWHDSYNLLIKKKSFLSSRASQGDLFYKYFFGHHCLGFHCTSACAFKMTKSYADIRIGDLWGKTYEKDDKGVTCVLAMTQRGNDILNSIDDIHKEITSVDVVCEGQMRNNAHAHPLRPFMLSMLRSRFTLKSIDAVVSTIELPLKVLRKLKLIKF